MRLSCGQELLLMCRDRKQVFPRRTSIRWDDATQDVQNVEVELAERLQRLSEDAETDRFLVSAAGVMMNAQQKWCVG
jgi:hypothetical protein